MKDTAAGRRRAPDSKNPATVQPARGFFMDEFACS
jgi:hypothetical protein